MVLHSVEFLLGIPGEVHAVDASGSTSFIRAAENGQLAVVEELVRAGADVDASTNLGDTALMGAAYQVTFVLTF
jgi:ankyrin repeat protein